MNNKILIVDDEQAYVRLVSLKLKENGYETFAANDAYQGIKMAHEVKPDLILLDLEMPAGTGVDTLEKLKVSSQTSYIPVIVITGVPNDEVEELITVAGADGFFRKPLNFNELLKKINEVLPNT